MLVPVLLVIVILESAFIALPLLNLGGGTRELTAGKAQSVDYRYAIFNQPISNDSDSEFSPFPKMVCWCTGREPPLPSANWSGWIAPASVSAPLANRAISGGSPFHRMKKLWRSRSAMALKPRSGWRI